MHKIRLHFNSILSTLGGLITHDDFFGSAMFLRKIRPFLSNTSHLYTVVPV